MLAAAIVALIVPQIGSAPAGAAADPVVTATPTNGLTDGQAVTINVKGTADTQVNEADVHVCRAGPAYGLGSVSGPARDFDTGGPNCPRIPLSSSADLDAIDADGPNFAKLEGDTFLFRVGTGVTTWKDNNGTDQTLKCDAENQCALVVELFVGTGTNVTWRPYVFILSFASDDPFAGCGGPAAGVLSSGGSDRMVDSWVAWTQVECKKPGRSGSATRASFVGEGSAVSDFAGGNLDLAYTAGGYASEMGLPRDDTGAPITGPRPAVAVPVALNATVLAVAGGSRSLGHNVPFKSIKLTLDEVATLLSGGTTSMAPYEQAIHDRNPELTQLFNTTAPGFSGGYVGAYADSEASSWYATRWLKTLAAGAWKVPDSPTFGTDRGRARGTDASLARADPSFANALSLLSGRPAARKGLIGTSADPRGVWLLTDLATAKALSLTPVEIQNSQGDFVPPTPESLLAALPTMKPDPAGVLIADPNASAAAGAVQPYPMAMVEYAIAPAEPLVDASCVARTDSQALLKGWLGHLVGDGQAALPAGFVALPPDLQAAAKAAVDKVGAAPVTGTCAGKVSTPAPSSPDGSSNAPPGATSPTPDATPAGGGGSDLVSGATGGFSSSASPGVSVGNVTPPAEVTAVSAALAASKPANEVGIPGFGGRGVVSWVLTAAALLGIIVVTSFAGLASSGKLPELRRRLRAKG